MMRVTGNLLSFALAVAISAAASAQVASAPGGPTVIAVPVLATPKIVDTPAGNTWALANQMADVISSDLKTTSTFTVADVKGQRLPSFPEVTAPTYSEWRAVGAKALLSGFVQARSDGRLMVGCYVYNVQAQRELTRVGFLVVPDDWRRAAHKCADAAYTSITGNSPLFDSRLAYIAQSGAPSSLVKRVAVMDFDGTNLTYVTTGDATAVTPRLSPRARLLAYTSLAGGEPHVILVDLASNKDRPLLPNATSFAPAFAPDGQSLALSIEANGNTDIYSVSTDGTGLRRLTLSPAIDTEPAFSPDGRHIVFSSDRSGSQQLYVMDADGSGQHRISFGPGEYGAPSWSPDGKRIAFTNITGGAMRIGIMDADGTHQKSLTFGPYDSEPTWGPSADRIMFQRLNPATGRTSLFLVSADGGQPQPVQSPPSGSDPSWVAGRE